MTLPERLAAPTVHWAGRVAKLGGMTESNEQGAVSNEVAVMPTIEVEVFDEQPFRTEAEAQRFMQETMRSLEEHAANQAVIQARLAEAERRGAAQMMGFSTFAACFEAVAADYRLTMPPEARMPLTASLRSMGRTVAEIASVTKASKASVHRDLERARTQGLLNDEPEKVMAADGRERPVRATKQMPRQVRRPDFTKTFRNKVGEAEKVYHSLRALSEDDRVNDHLSTLSGNHRALVGEIAEFYADLYDRLSQVNGE